MDLNAMIDMDPNIVLSIVNEQLRLECDSLEELITRFDLDSGTLTEKMDKIGYHYDAKSNQFKPV